jgi:hypothetical protein
MATDIVTMFADAEAAVFTPAAGDPVSLQILFTPAVDLQPGGVTAQVWEQGTTIEVIYADIGREPNRGETITYDGTVYTIQTILANDGITVKMAVT